MKQKDVIEKYKKQIEDDQEKQLKYLDLIMKELKK